MGRVRSRCWFSASAWLAPDRVAELAPEPALQTGQRPSGSLNKFAYWPPSKGTYGSGFNDIAHETGRIPVCGCRLHFACVIGAANLKDMIASLGKFHIRFPASERIFALRLAQLRRFPCLAA